MELEAVVPFTADFERHFAVFPFPSRRRHFQRGKILLVAAPSIRTHKHEKERILSRREQYEEMEKENPSIAKLREFLNLELA